MRTKLLITTLVVGGFTSACASVRSAPPAITDAKVTRSIFAMGTSLEMKISVADRASALLASESAARAVADDEKRLSTWRPESELSRLNALPVGTGAEPSAATARDLHHALACAAETDHAFNPFIGPLVRAWGIRTGGRLPSAREIARARAASAPDAFTWAGSRLVRHHADAAIEEGGFGKGVALDDAISALSGAGVRAAVLNFGGQVSVLGDASAPIEVSSPTDRTETILRFHAGEGSIATSANSEHGVRVHTPNGERRLGHLLDSRTGEPAPYDGSVTVMATAGVDADCRTKIFVLGVDAGMEWARRHAAAVLWVTPAPNGRFIARTSCAWKPKLEILSPQVELRPDCTVERQIK